MQLISRENTIEDLVKFVKLYMRRHKKRYQIPWAKIPDYLPRELKTIYHEFGNFPSNQQWANSYPTLPLNDDDTQHLFHNQDALVYFNQLEEEGDRVAFAWENQGNWTAETETYKDDPPVYLDGDLGDVTSAVLPRLSHFLATLCLHELVFGSNYMHHLPQGNDAVEQLISKSTAVWLNGPYAYPGWQHSFYLTGDNLLLMVVADPNISACIGSNEDYDNIDDSPGLQHFRKAKDAEA